VVLATRPHGAVGTTYWELSTVVHKRLGYTLAEMMIVVVIVGGLTLFALPRFSGLTERNSLAAARQEVIAAIATARAAAIQKGSSATVRIKADSVSVTVVNAGGVGTTTLIPARSLDALYGVEMVPRSQADTAITFDMRGFAKLSGSPAIRFGKGSRRDSVCLTIAGQIMPRGCTL
jgi:prepilin-type N-terminal cleavage/methylation domain-containing protein